MRTMFLFTALVMALPTFGQKQATKSSLDNLSASFDVLGTYKQHDIHEYGMRAEVGYEFVPNLSVFARYESSIGIYKYNGVKDHFSSNVLGGGVAYRFANCSNGGNVRMNLALLGNIGSNDWKKTVYDASITWKIRDGLSPSLTLGFRHENSYSNGIPNMNYFYGGIGVRF